MGNFLSEIAISAVSLLIALVAIYLSLRLMGKIAKFVICLVIIVFTIWLFVSDSSILNVILTQLR
ncbi:MAG: hypothetical protein IJY22_02380 [Clostridia bacterium]|nr:hypothetical protein [Clostridia bacterium]